MEQYIKKSALVSEIEKIRKALNLNLRYDQGVCNGLYDIQKYINTLEVKEVGIDLGDPKGDKSAKCIIDTNTLEAKEVDLEKEIDRYYNIEAPKEFEDVLYEDIEKFAKHFYSLGLKAQKGE